MSRSLDAAEFVVDAQPGDVSWGVKAPSDCGKRGCRAHHTAAIGVGLFRRGGDTEPVVTIQCAAMIDTPFGEMVERTSVTLRGRSLIEFLDDLDELRRMLD